MKSLKTLAFLVIVLSVFLSSHEVLAQPFAYIPAGDTVSVIDTTTNTITTTIAISGGFPMPAGVAVSLDGTRVYVADSNNDTVSVIDAATNTVIATITVGNSPVGVAVNPAGSRVYVGNAMDDTVSVIDTTTNTVVDTVTVGDGPGGVAVHPTGSRIYVTNAIDDTVSVIDTSFNLVVATVPVGFSPRGVAVHPDGTSVYVINATEGSVSVVDAVTNTEVAILPVGFTPEGFGDFIGPLTGEVQFLGLTPSQLGIYKVGDTITFTATAIGPEPIYYKFWYRAGYGTAGYGTNPLNPFVVMQDFSVSNSATHTFSVAGNYIVLVWGTDDPNSVVPSDVPIIGMNVNVEN